MKAVVSVDGAIEKFSKYLKLHVIEEIGAWIEFC